MVNSPAGKSAAAGKSALVRHQFGTNRVLYKRVQSLGPKNAKQRFSRLNVSATKDLPLPVILDRDFDKEGSRVYKRTVRYRAATDGDKNKKRSRIWCKLMLACRFSPSAIGLRIGAQGAIVGTFGPFLG